MDDFRLNTIVTVSLDALSSDFSKWITNNRDNYQLLYCNTSEISNSKLFELYEGEIIIFLFKSFNSSSIVTNKRVLSITQNGDIYEMKLEHIQKVNRPKEYYMEEGVIKKTDLKQYIEIISNDNKLIKLYIDTVETLYFVRILICNLFFIATKNEYYYLPSNYRN